MISKKYIITIFTSFFILFGHYNYVLGQQNNTLYFMNRVPQSSQLNPAIENGCGLFIGLPVLSSIYMNFGNNSLSFNDIIYKGTGLQSDSLITFLHPSQDIDDFLNKLKEKNIISTEFQTSLLSFGIQVKEIYFSFGIYDKLNFQISLPKDLATIVLKGNSEFIGETADFSHFGANANYYREYALGASLKALDQLTVGGRVKLLFGKANFSTHDVDMGLYTSHSNDLLRLYSQMTINSSLPMIEVKKDSIGDFDGIATRDDFKPSDLIFGGANAGCAIDLGASFQLTDQITLSGSIIDMGFIRWKNNVINIIQDGELEFTGLDVSSALDKDEDASFAEELMDEIDSTFTLSDRSDAYIKSIGTKLYVGGTYKLNENVSFGLLSRSQVTQKKFRQAVTLSANVYVLKAISASLSYSIMNNSYSNIGLGLGLRGGPVQFYLISDGIPGMFLPHKTHSTNFHFGLNLIFGCNKGNKEEE